MIYSVNWATEAEETFHQNIEYLLKKWNIQVLNQFLDRVDAVLQKIESNPFLYPLHESLNNIRKCVVNEHIILYYRVIDDVSIDLITFWNTHQNPDRLSF